MTFDDALRLDELMNSLPPNGDRIQKNFLLDEFSLQGYDDLEYLKARKYVGMTDVQPGLVPLVWLTEFGIAKIDSGGFIQDRKNKHKIVNDRRLDILYKWAGIVLAIIAIIISIIALENGKQNKAAEPKHNTANHK